MGKWAKKQTERWRTSLALLCPIQSLFYDIDIFVIQGIYARYYQAIAVTEGHSAGLGLVLQMPHILAVGEVWVTPCQSAFLPVLDTKLAGQQAILQREVQEEAGARCGQLVIKLWLRNLLFCLGAPPMAPVPV